MDQIRVGIVGCGEVTQIIHLPSLYRLSDQFVVTETFPTGEQYGFAVTKENTALLAALNSALAASKEDGTYDAAYTAWFGELKD